MAIDVSVYTLRVNDGALSTVGGGSMRSVGLNPTATATGSGGSITGVVRTTGDQRINGLKIFDNSTMFTYDVSVLGGVDVSSYASFGQDVSVGANFYVDGSYFNTYIRDAVDTSVLGVTDGSALVYDSASGQWIPGKIGSDSHVGDVSIGGNLFVTGDVSMNNLVVNTIRQISGGATFLNGSFTQSSGTATFNGSKVHVDTVSNFFHDVSIREDLYVEQNLFAEGNINAVDVSISNDLWVGGNIYGTLVIDTSAFDTLTVTNDASIGGDLYVDGSILLGDFDVEIRFDNIDTSLGDVYTRIDGSINDVYTYIDASVDVKANKNTVINQKTSAYTLVSGDNNDVIDASGTWTLTLPDSLDNGFQVTIVNTGEGNITLDASNLLTTDASVVLRKQYAGASAVHAGSGKWFAWGNLE